MKLNSWLLSLSVVAAAQIATAGDVTGKVTLKGTPAPENIINEVKNDPNCGKMHAEPVKTRFYVTDGKGGLADVFVYLKQGAKPAPAAGEGPLLDQVNCIYEPQVIGVQAGQKLKVRNSDSVMHNIHAMPNPSLGNPEFNFGQPIKGQVTEKQFDKPEVLVRVKCDVHPWMFAYIGVVEHPYFAVSGKDGSFTIKNVPPGKYTIEAFHRKTHMAAGKGEAKEITVGSDGAKGVDFTVELK